MPTNAGKIYNLATKNYDGIVADGAAIPVTMVTAAQMLSAATAFKNAEKRFNTARKTVPTSYWSCEPAVDILQHPLLTGGSITSRVFLAADAIALALTMTRLMG
ncbi:MAG TPA: hypothetical protein VGI60_01850 [Chthoniobacterales bacterium]